MIKTWGEVAPRLIDVAAGRGPADLVIRKGRWVNVPGGGAAVEAAANAVYLALSLRNVGAGLAVLQGWQAHSVTPVEPESEAAWRESVQSQRVPDVEDFRPLTRDQYIASGDVGVWQGALRDPADPLHAALTAATAERRRFLLDLLYTDQIGGQRTRARIDVEMNAGAGAVNALTG